MIKYCIIYLAQNLFNLLKSTLDCSFSIHACTCYTYLHYRCNNVKNEFSDTFTLDTFILEVTVFYNQEGAQKQMLSSSIGVGAFNKGMKPSLSFDQHVQ